MTDKLIEATRQAMDYTEQLKTCYHCQYLKGHDEKADECTYSNICRFPVTHNASCRFFEQRKGLLGDEK